MLDGILPEDLKLPDTVEPARPRKLLATHPVMVRAILDGQPLAGATVTFHKFNTETEKYVNTADGMTDAKGQVKMTTYAKFDGVPVGEYAVTVVWTRRGYYDGEIEEKSKLPAKYATADKSPLKVVVKEGTNEINLELTSK
jgi:hypothetical protein